MEVEKIMVTPWKYEKEADKIKKTDPGLLELMKELVGIVHNILKDEDPDDLIGKRSVYHEFKGGKRHRIFEFIDLRSNSDKETRKKFLVRGLFVCMMEIGENGAPLDVSYCIRIPNSPNFVTEETMSENRALAVSSFKEVVGDIKRSGRIEKEDYVKYVDKAIEGIINRRKKE